MEEEVRRRWDLEEGDEIVPGRYALRKLGGGYDYEAYLAWDERMCTLVVAKILRPHLLGNARLIDAMQREADQLRRLDHPVILRSFGADLEAERPHIVLEYLDGPNLNTLIRQQKRISLEQLLPLAFQVCSALHYLRAEDLIHLDVKPGNIIMGSPPRLVDFSVARTSARAAKIDAAIGTDAYMAPEQCDWNHATISFPADVWGLGASMFHALTGQLPFAPEKHYDDDYNTVEVNLDNPIERWPQLGEEIWMKPLGFPDEIVDPIFACLRKDAEARPDPVELIGMIEPVIAGLPTRPVLRKMRPGAGWRKK